MSTVHAISGSPAWTAAGWTMLHLVWIGAAGGLGAALVRRLMRAARPETRHGVAVACLLGLAVVPFVLFAWLYRPEPLTVAGRAEASRTEPAGRATVDLAPLRDMHRAGGELATAASPATLSSRFEPLVGYLPGVWMCGSAVTLALLAAGLFGVERLRRSSRPLEAGAIAERCSALAGSLGVARRVGVAICDRIAAPILIGVIRPLILLPPSALCGWSIEQIEMVLLHELAHIRRHDNVVILLQRLVESLLFFHPVTWWLSAWVSLERELCCDRLVVEHNGRPQAYARVLAALAGAGGARAVALAMARRPLTMRIRRILDMEDRSMKMTLTEGLGLIAATVAGTMLILATQARPPQPVTADASRRALARLAARVVAQPDEESEHDGKGYALLEIAENQLKLGDRAAALATVRLFDGLPEPPAPKQGANADTRAWERLSVMTSSAGVRSAAGDRDGARAALGRAVKYFEVLDTGAVRRMVDTVIAAEKSSPPMHLDGEAEIVADLSEDLIDRCIALGETELARTLIRRLVDAVGPPKGRTTVMIALNLGDSLVKAGDSDGGRALIERSRQAALALADPEVRAFAMQIPVFAKFETGDLDGALAMLREMTPQIQQSALWQILDALAKPDSVDDHRDLHLDGIDIRLGYAILSPKDPNAARAALPKIAAAAGAWGDVIARARILATVAPFQANAGDFTGALKTARSIPDLRRSGFPAPDGRLLGINEAVKPITIAFIAGAQAKAGDQTAAAAALGEAEDLTRGLAAEDQKLIAQVVIAQKNAACGRRESAKAIINEARTLALTQREPRRSRVLEMLVGAQVQAGDAPGAERTINDIRESPGLEKVGAMSVLARWHEAAGDAVTSRALLRRAVGCLEAKSRETPVPGNVIGANGVGRDTLAELDLEMNPALPSAQREPALQDIRIWLGDVEAAVRAARALPPEGRDEALSDIAGGLARRGDVAGALDLAATIESPDARMEAFASMAAAIPEMAAKEERAGGRLKR